MATVSCKTKDYIYINKLPSVIVCEILSMLTWREKLLIPNAIPAWIQYLEMAGAWRNIRIVCEYRIAGNQSHGEMDRDEFLQLILGCINNYGCYFQSCTFDMRVEFQCGQRLEILQHLAKNCKNLKWISIYHALHMSSPGVYQSVAQHLNAYVSLLSRLQQQNPNLYRIYLYNLYCDGVDLATGDVLLFQKYLENGLHQRISGLEFYDICGIEMHIPSISDFRHLSILKCPIQAVNQDIVLNLSKKNLTDLYLVHDSITPIDSNYHEKYVYNWEQIAQVSPGLKVHYTFIETTLRDTDVCLNPLARTLVIDSLCNQICSKLLTAIGSKYGKSLETFVHLGIGWCYAPYENPVTLPIAYQRLITACPNLNKLVIGVDIPASVFPGIVHERNLQAVMVDQEKISFDMTTTGRAALLSNLQRNEMSVPSPHKILQVCENLETLNQEMSLSLGSGWKALLSQEFKAQSKHFIRFYSIY